MTLDENHIAYIEKDMAYRGIVDEDLGEELLDHICELVAVKMANGTRFIEAYDATIASFGDTKTLWEIQHSKITKYNNNTRIMLRNYLKIALRNLSKHKFYSFINVIGLSVGVACSLMILLYVANEKKYDTFHTDVSRMYRLTQEMKYGDNEMKFPTNPAPMAEAIETGIPEIEKAVRMRQQGSYIVTNPLNLDAFKEPHVVYADPGFFELFTFPLLEGDKKSVLSRENTVAISESAARKFFGDEPAMGKALVFDGDEEYTITGVFEDMPDNSHLKFDYLLSMSTLMESKSTMWLSNNFYTYVKLREGANLEEVKAKVGDLSFAKVKPQIEQYIGKDIGSFFDEGNYLRTIWQPMDQVYLTSSFTFDIGRMGNGNYVNLFAVIAIFIIILACINFMNLATARSTTRAKEVGVRKVLGSMRKHLVRQFLMESILMSFLAFVLGLGMVSLALPVFNQLSDTTLTIPWSVPFVLLLLASAIGVGLLAGLYPALFLSSFKPVEILKGKLGVSGHSFIRNGLVTFQFFISIILIIGTIAINQQLNYIQNRNAGFDKEQVLMVQDAYALKDQRASFKKEVEQISSVRSASYSSYVPVSGYSRSDNSFWKEGLSPSEENLIATQIWVVDEDYLETMGMKLVSGRFLDKDIASDTAAVVLNQQAFKAFDLKEGEDNWIQTYQYNYETGESITDAFNKFKVIGVIEDFHFESMKQNINPLALSLGPSTGVLSVKLSTTDLQQKIGEIEEVWDEMGSGLPFTYVFLDEEFGRMYQAESRLSRILILFAGLAIFIGCLGLFGLASYMAERRTKEIGIRKVLGASVNSIVFMLSKHFSLLMLIAFLLATPLAWWGISSWLETYNYRITLGPGIFLIAGILAFSVAGLTVAYQSIKAALSNPVDSLRNE